MARGLWIAAVPAAMKFYMPLRGKTKQPRLRRVEMHPYSRCAGLPPEGEVYSPLNFYSHKQFKV